MGAEISPAGGIPRFFLLRSGFLPCWARRRKGASVLSDEQLLAVYRDYKCLLAVSLIVEGARYRFQMLTGAAEGRQGILVSGWIDAQGAIEIEKREPAFLICPICLAAGTRIATPQGKNEWRSCASVM